MSDLRFSFPACVIAGKGEITPDDVGLMRHHMWPDGITSRYQASMALALHDCCTTHCPEWTDYLVEAIAEFVVWRDSTDGDVTGETAGWLLEKVASAGAVRSTAGLEIILHVLDIARNVPGFLSAAALNQLRLALLPESRGAYAQRRLESRGVTKADLAYLWRILRSAVDRGSIRLARAEQLILGQIDRLADEAENHPGWRDVMLLTEIASRSDDIRATEWLLLDEDIPVTEHAAA
nr:hypothetical protein RKHAN_01691 [Rhizobium sp. Khangiran2]